MPKVRAVITARMIESPEPKSARAGVAIPRNEATATADRNMRTADLPGLVDNAGETRRSGDGFRHDASHDFAAGRSCGRRVGSEIVAGRNPRTAPSSNVRPAWMSVMERSARGEA